MEGGDTGRGARFADRVGRAGLRARRGRDRPAGCELARRRASRPVATRPRGRPVSTARSNLPRSRNRPGSLGADGLRRAASRRPPPDQYLRVRLADYGWSAAVCLVRAPRGLFCYDLEGELLWNRDLGELVTRFGWGEGTSPVIHGDSLIVNGDHEGQSFLTVLDPATGDTKWRVERRGLQLGDAPSRRIPGPLATDRAGHAADHRLRPGRRQGHLGVRRPDDQRHSLSGGLSGFGNLPERHQGNEGRAVRLDSQGDVTADPRQVAWQLHRDTPYVRPRSCTATCCT